MNAKLTRRLVSLYPGSWRARYGDEFEAFLEAHPATLSGILDVIGSALVEQLRAAGDFRMDARQRTLVLMALAYLAAVAAGVNFYWTVSDTPLAAVMKSRPMLALSFRAVALGSLAAFAAVASVALPATSSIAIDAFNARRWRTLGRIAVPFASAFVVFAWLAAATIVTGRHWVATPWDVTGDWPAPAEWPPLPIRWTMGSVTFALLLCGLAASATAAIQVIRESDFSRFRDGWFRFPSVALAVSTAFMTAGVAGWGWFAQQYAAADFHSRNGGLFNSTNILSWTASVVVFAGASAMAFLSARGRWHSQRTTLFRRRTP
jgi:hypothetical protein